MRIFFYDGLLDAAPVPQCEHYELVDAKYGPDCNRIRLECSLISSRNIECSNFAIVTNSILALDHAYGWNHSENHTDIYLYVVPLKDYVRIDKLTEKELREGHNIAKMYLAGIFDFTGELYD